MPSDFSRVVEQSVLQASNVIANQGGTLMVTKAIVNVSDEVV